MVVIFKNLLHGYACPDSLSAVCRREARLKTFHHSVPTLRAWRRRSWSDARCPPEETK